VGERSKAINDLRGVACFTGSIDPTPGYLGLTPQALSFRPPSGLAEGPAPSLTPDPCSLPPGPGPGPRPPAPAPVPPFPMLNFPPFDLWGSLDII
jgi:hypothetical protein